MLCMNIGLPTLLEKISLWASEPEYSYFLYVPCRKQDFLKHVNNVLNYILRTSDPSLKCTLLTNIFIKFL